MIGCITESAHSARKKKKKKKKRDRGRQATGADGACIPQLTNTPTIAAEEEGPSTSGEEALWKWLKFK